MVMSHESKRGAYSKIEYLFQNHRENLNFSRTRFFFFFCYLILLPYKLTGVIKLGS